MFISNQYEHRNLKVLSYVIYYIVAPANASLGSAVLVMKMRQLVVLSQTSFEMKDRIASTFLSVLAPATGDRSFMEYIPGFYRVKLHTKKHTLLNPHTIIVSLATTHLN